MSNKREQQLLFSNFKDTGIIDEVKLNLRMLICKKIAEQGKLKVQSKKNIEDRILASLIYQQLQISNCECSQSIYVVESGYQQTILQRQELIDLLILDNSNLNNKQSILHNLIKQAGNTNKSIVNRSVQVKKTQTSLQEKLKLIQHHYTTNNNTQSNTNLINIQNHIKTLEMNLKQQFNKDLERFKQFEIHRIKLMIWQQCRKKYDEKNKEIEAKYAQKLESLRLKERTFQEEFLTKNKFLTSKTNIVESNLQQKMSLIQLKNQQTQKSIYNMKQEYQILNQNLKSQSKQLKIKINEYNQLQSSLNQKIAYETNLAKLALMQEMDNKQLQFRQKEKVINEEYEKIMCMKQSIQSVKRQNNRVYEENNRLRESLRETQMEYRKVMGDLGLKIQRIQILQNQISEEKQNQKKGKENIEKLQNKTRRLQKQLLHLTEQLERLRANRVVTESQGDLQIQYQSSSISKLNEQCKKLRQNRRKQIEIFKRQTQ